MDNQIDEQINVVTGFLESDKMVSAVLLNELMQKGTVGIEDISRTVSAFLDRNGFDIHPKKVMEVLETNYNYGVVRFVGEYNNGNEILNYQVNENADVLLGENGCNVAQRRYSEAMDKVNSLERRPSAWSDFVDRSISNMVDLVGMEYGIGAEKNFIRLARMDERNSRGMHAMLEESLSDWLRDAHRATLTSEAVQNFSHSVQDVRDIHVSKESDSYSNLASMFK